VAHAAREAPGPCAGWAVVAVAQGVLVPAELWLTKHLVDGLAARVSASTGAVEPAAAANGERAFLWLALLVAALLVQRGLEGLVPLLVAMLRGSAGPALREDAMAKATRLDLASFEHQGYYDQVARVLDTVEGRVPAVVGQLLHGMVRNAPAAVAYGVVLWAVSPLLLGTVLVGWAPALYVFYRGGKSHFGLVAEQTRERRLADYYGAILTGRPFAKETRLYQLAGYALERWTALFWRTRNAQRAHALRIGLRQRGSILFSSAAGVVGLFWVVTSGLTHASPGEYALLFQSLHGIVQALFSIANTAKVFGTQAEYAADYRAFLALPEEPAAAAARSNGRASDPGDAGGAPFPRPLARAIRFELVSFTYPGAAGPAVDGVTLELRAGEKVALVGENGAGKSTLAKLLLGLYQPDAGVISADGLDSRQIDPRSWRAAVSAVFQQFVRYHLTLGENVSLGQPERRWDREAVVAAARRAGAAALVDALPRGYETQLGPDMGGVDLSGGEWQRIAVARSFFREAQVLVLDEPTAALDPLAELAVFERFVELAQGKTAVLVSHRLGMARLADRVLVLSRGRLVEDGTHAELMRAGGEYAALFGAQARWYA